MWREPLEVGSGIARTNARAAAGCGTRLTNGRGRARRFLRRDAPDRVADVVRHQQRAGAVRFQSDGAAAGLAVGGKEAGQHVLRLGAVDREAAGGEGDEHHLVARHRLAVPRAVLADQRALRVAVTQLHAVGEGEAECGDVRPQCVIGTLRILLKVGALRVDARVRIAAPIEPRPAELVAQLDLRQIIGREVRSQHVAFVDDGPQLLVVGADRHALRVAQAAGIDAERLLLRVDLEDVGTEFLCVQAVFRDVRRRSDADEQRLAVGCRDQRARPVIAAAVQLDDQFGLSGNLRRAVGVGDADQRIGVGNVKLAAHQRHAGRRVEPGHEDVAFLGDAVAVRVTEQRDAVRRGHAGAGLLQQQPHDEALDTAAVARGAVRFGDQHVAVGQAVEPARMVEAACERLDRQPGGGGGGFVALPADDVGDLHRGQRLVARFGDRGALAGDLVDRQLRGVGPGEIDDDAHGDDSDERGEAQDVLQHGTRIGIAGPAGKGAPPSHGSVRPEPVEGRVPSPPRWRIAALRQAQGERGGSSDVDA